MEEAHLIMCLAWAIGLVMVIIGDVFWDDTMFWIGVVIWISASCLIFAMRGLACILKCLPKLRVQDSSPTNSRTSDEGTNWTITIARYKFNHLATKLTTFVAFPQPFCRMYKIAKQNRNIVQGEIVLPALKFFK